MPSNQKVLLNIRKPQSGRGRLMRFARREKCELLEARMPLTAAPIQFGAVYIEQDLGSDANADSIEVSFLGGAPGTQLTRIVLNGDKFTAGLSFADMIFDTVDTGLGVDLPFDSVIAARQGEFDAQIVVEDGSSQLTLLLEGFEAGEKLTLAVDVDEVQGYDPDETNLSLINEELDPIASGAEFQGTQLTAYFAAPHFYDADATAEFRNHYDRLLDPTDLDLPRDDDGGIRDRTAGGVGELEQTPLPISISGRVYEDNNTNLHQDADELGLENVELALFYEQDGSYVFTGHTTTTDANGDYLFEETLGLLPGDYEIRESQPDGYFSVGAEVGTVAGQLTGSIQTADILTSISIPQGGTHARNYNFAEARSASIRGQVHLSSPDGDCWDDSIEHEPVVGATILLLDADGETVAETQTDTNGQYEFLELRPGEYSLVELTPEDLIAGGSRAGQVEGETRGEAHESRITEIELFSGDDGEEYEFCDHLPAKLRGSVYHDRDDDGLRETGEEGIADAILSLLDEDGLIVDTVETDEDGRYEFVGIRKGNYRVIELQPDGWLDGKDRAGTANGRSTGTAINPGDAIEAIQLLWGDEGIDFDFGELKPVSLEGRVHLSTPDGDCWNIDEELLEPVAGAVVQLLDSNGKVLAETVTDDDGNYLFEDLAPGDYAIRQITPEGLVDGGAQAGSVNGEQRGQVTDAGNIQQIRLNSDEDGQDYDFCEHKPAVLSGFVYDDLDNDGVRDPGEGPIEGVLIQLFDENGNLVAETTTDENGKYVFEGLPPGKYSLRQIQPDGYLDGLDSAGTVDGEHRGRAINPGDLMLDITLGWGETGEEYNFGELRPASLSGFVYEDADNDGVREPGEGPIADAVIQLFDENGNFVAETQTDATGAYSFENLPPGNYSLRQIQPDEYLDGLDSAGTVDGERRGRAINPGDEIVSISLGPGESGREFNFGELRPASLSGFVHSSPEEDCWNDENATPLAGVRIMLLGEDGRIVAETTTNSIGEYSFDDLPPSKYSVVQEQPAGQFDGAQRAGTSGGDASESNLIKSIDLGSGVDATNYDFCEIPPATISGFVFVDGAPVDLAFGESLPQDLSNIRPGELSDDDTRIASVRLELRDGITGEAIDASLALPGEYEDGVIQTETDEFGFYEFTGLPKGNYSVYEIQPDGYFDGIDTPGTTDGIAINPLPLDADDIFLETVMNSLVVPPQNDAIVRIGLPAGSRSELNNFSEVLTSVAPPPDDPPPPFIDEPVETPFPPGINIKVPDLYRLRRDESPIPKVDDPIPSDGSYGARSNTWHLSIIDGGQPRVSSTTSETQLLFPTSLWRPQEMESAKWQIDSPSDETAVFFFGLEDSQPITGDFNGDGTTEIGVFADGHWFIDLNGNGRWDSQDLWAKLGNRHDMPVVGDWDGDGKDDIGIFGRTWPGDTVALEHEHGLPDMDNVPDGAKKNMPPTDKEAPIGRRVMKHTARGRLRADLIDHVFLYGSAGDVAVSGDWNGDGIDTVGVFRNGVWRLDVDGNGEVTDLDEETLYGRAGDVPIVGDFNGDGIDDLAIIRDGKIYVDINSNREIDANDLVIVYDASEGSPIVGKWAGDSADRIGLFQPIDESRYTVAGRLETE